MPVLPPTKLAQIEFFEAHLPVWAANFAAIGLTAPQVASLTTLTASARATYNTSNAKREDSKAATTAYNNAHVLMRDLGGDLISTIKAFAETTNAPGVYATAQIPPPAPPTPPAPPEQPDDLNAVIDPFGVMQLTWKATPKGPSTGIFFFVERKVGTGVWTPLGATQDPLFADQVGQACEAVIQYRVQARRGGVSSPWSDPLSVDFSGGTDSIAGFVDGGEEGGMAEAA